MIPLEYYQALAKRIYFKDGQPFWNENSMYINRRHTLAGAISSHGYRNICATINKKRRQLSAGRLHWFILHGEIPSDEIDHINRIKDDNSPDNLRECTRSQNNRNRKSKNSTSQFNGVSWHKNRNKWQARITIKQKLVHLGIYTFEIDAAKAYDAAIIKYKLTKFSVFNFPQK